jgi:hypothetical protein
VRVSHVAGTKHDVTANVMFHKDSTEGEAFQGGTYTFKPNMDGANFIKQAYDHLKTLPEFTNAQDC